MKTIKKLLSVSAIGLFAVSCSQSDELSSNKSESTNVPITFVTKVPGTRINVKSTSNFVNGDSVGIYSYSKIGDLANDFSLTGGLFSNTKMTYNGTSWSYGNLKYWSKNANEKLSLLAYFPYVKTAQTENILAAPTMDASSIKFSVKLPTTLANQKDFMWAKITNVVTANQTTAQNLSFFHAYAQMAFKLKLAATYTGVTIKLKKLELLNLNNEGTFSIDKNLSVGVWSFNGTQPNFPEANFTLFDGSQTLTTSYVELGGGTNVMDYRTFVIPRIGFDDNLELQLTYTVEYADGTPTQNVVIKKSFIKSMEAGNTYVNQINVAINNISFNPPSVQPMPENNVMPEDF